MELMTIKLKSSNDDLLAYITESDETTVTVKSPILIRLEPNHGFFARDWLFLSEVKEADIDRKDIFLIAKASKRSVDIYDEYTESVSETDAQDDVNNNDLHDIFTSFLESKTSTKH